MKMRHVIKVLAALVIVLAMTMPGRLASGKSGGRPDPRILPPGSTPYGGSYGDWAARWWQWALSIPAPVNPMADLTGDDADEGQTGDVWFLAGIWGGLDPYPDLPLERTCTVPAGKALFFPIINLAWVTVPADLDPEADPPPELYPSDPSKWFIENEWEGVGIRPLLDYFMDTASELWCEIDGKPVHNIDRFREQSSVTYIWYPEDSISGDPPGIQGPAVDTGYYLMVAPLAPGEHTIEFHGSMWGEQHVIYHLTVDE